jgi:hypothetical protein
MARIRTIKPELFEDEALGQCSRDARFLFVGLISHSDDHGRQRGSARLILANVFPYDEDIGPREIGQWLVELAQAGVILLYEYARQSFIEIENWGKHQRVDKVKATEFPDPPTSPETPVSPGARSAGATSRSAGATEGNGRDQGEGATSSLVELVFGYWQERCEHPKAKLDPKRRRAIGARIREGATEDEIRLGIEGAARGAFVSASGVRFDDIALICRDRVKLDLFIARATATPKAGLDEKDAAMLNQLIGVTG